MFGVFALFFSIKYIGNECSEKHADFQSRRFLPKRTWPNTRNVVDTIVKACTFYTRFFASKKRNNTAIQTRKKARDKEEKVEKSVVYFFHSTELVVV